MQMKGERAHLRCLRRTLSHQAPETSSDASTAPATTAPAMQALPHSGCLEGRMAPAVSASCLVAQ